MSGGMIALLAIAAGVAGGLCGHTPAEGVGIGVALNIIVQCTDAICTAIRERR
jgi:hypothetical protein